MTIAVISFLASMKTLDSIQNLETYNIYRAIRQVEETDVVLLAATKTPYADCFSDYDFSEFEKVIIVSSRINYFGGVDTQKIEEKYHKLADYKGTIYYIQTDIRFKFRQLQPSKHKNFKYVPIENDVVYITHQKNMTIDKLKTVEVNVTDSRYFDIQKHILYIDTTHNENNSFFSFEKEFDIMYYGEYKADRKFNEFLYDLDDIEAVWYGATNYESVSYETKSPAIRTKIKPMNLMQEMSKSLCALFMHSSGYTIDTHETLRLYEILSSKETVILIDIDYDPQMKIFGGDERFYIRDKKDMMNKIRMMKNDMMLYNELLDKQHSVYKSFYNADEWFENLKEVLN